MISNGLADLSLLNNIKKLSLKKVNEFPNSLVRRNDIKHLIIIQLDKDSKISVDLMTYRLSNNQADIWHIISRHKYLQQLILIDPNFEVFMPNIEPLMRLEEIKIESLYFDDFDTITMFAPNLE